MTDDRGTEATGVLRGDLLLEWYRYPPGPAVVLPGHTHEEYQINLNLDLPGGVSYRGAFHTVPTRRLAIIMPGEVHTPRDPDERREESTHLVLYVRPEALEAAALALSPANRNLPYFRDPVIGDTEVIERFARMHAALAGPLPTLEQDVRVLTVLVDLVSRHTSARSHQPVRSTHRAVRRAQDYLHDKPTANVSLAELAQVSGLSPYHLTRQFTATIGMPPHSYQLQLRVERAKRLVLAGRSVSDAGHEAGFFDQSHFTRHFKRFVGVSPGAYARQQGARTYMPTP